MSVKEFKLEVNKREGSSKKSRKKIRREGSIPGIYYSYDSKESISFSIDQKELSLAQKSGAQIFNVSVGNKKRNVIFKSVQYHPVTDEILHIDLYGVKMDQKITVKVLINLIGDPKGVKQDGGVLNSPTSDIEIECLPMDIPGSIEVDISELSLGDSLQVSDISLDEKHTLMSSSEAVIASVTHAMREEEPVVEEDGDDEFMDEDSGQESEASDDPGESTEGE